MRTFAAFRTALHTAFYFSAASLTGVFAGCIPLPLAVAAALLILGLIAVELDKPALRLLVLLPSALCLLLADGLVSAAVAAVPIIYALIMISLGLFSMEHRLFIREIKLAAFVEVLLILATLFMGYIIREEMQVPLACTYSSWIFLVCAFLFGIIALRAHRSGDIRSLKWQAGNIGFFLLPIAIAGAAGILVMLFVQPILKYVLYGVSTSFMVFLVGVSQAMYNYFAFTKDMEGFAETTPPPVPSEEAGEAIFTQPTPEPAFIGKTVRHLDINYGLIAVIAAAVVLAVVLFLIFRKARSMKREYRDDGLRRYDIAQETSRSGRRRRRSLKNADGAAKVREVYRRYLSFLRQHGVVPVSSETSGEITDDASRIIHESDEELRELYRMARYDNAAVLNDADVKRAEEALERITAVENIRDPREESGEARGKNAEV